MIEIPETRDLFYPLPETAVAYGNETASRIGKDLEADILVVDSTRVVARQGEQESVVNSSVEQYRDSLALVANTRDGFAAGTIDDVDAAVDGLEEDLRSLDAVAFDAPNSYWGAIVEQIRFEQF